MSKTLKDCCSFQEGYVNPSQKESKYFGGDILWLRTLDLTDIYIDDTSQKLTQEGYNSAGKSAKMFPENSIAINKSGTIIGAVSILKKPMCGNRAVIDIVVNPDTPLMYIYYLLKYKHGEINKKAVGSIQKNLYVSALETIELTTDNYDEQKKIADVLQLLDNKIFNNNRICSDLESMAKLLYDYWLVQFDFPDENGKPYKSSGGKMEWSEELNREIPEGWEVIPLGDFITFTKGRIPNELVDSATEEFNSPYITIEVANNGIPQYCRPEAMVQCNGETIMVMDGAASGDVYLGNEGSLGSTFSMVSSRRNDITNSFVYMLLKSNRSIYKRANTGSTVPHANRQFIERMKLALPKDASKFSKQLDLIFDKEKQIRTENQQLTSLRDFLLPMLMNGQVKVTSN